MKKILFIAIIALFVACNSNKETNKNEASTTIEKVAIPDFNVALQFINEYVAYQSNLTDSSNTQEWIQNHSLLSDNFKKSYKELMDNAAKNDPEIGLGFDPIFNAQDFPDKGFAVAKTDSVSGTVLVKGVDWDDFNVSLKVISEKGKSMVDGAGVVNSPK